MRRILPLITTFAMLAGPTAYAATIIDTLEGGAEMSTMTVDGLRARMQSEPGAYTLVDVEKRSFLSVDTNARLIIDMSVAASVARAPVRPAVRAELVAKGRGPRIAGYDTQHYQLLANGRLCADTYLSIPALQAAGMADFLEGFAQYFVQQKTAQVAMGADFEPCEDAQQLATESYPKLGLAMRTVDSDGFLRQEIKRIRTRATITADAFSLPSGFRALTLEEYLRQDAAQGDAAMEAWLREKQGQEPTAQPPAGR